MFQILVVLRVINLSIDRLICLLRIVYNLAVFLQCVVYAGFVLDVLVILLRLRTLPTIILRILPTSGHGNPVAWRHVFLKIELIYTFSGKVIELRAAPIGPLISQNRLHCMVVHSSREVAGVYAVVVERAPARRPLRPQRRVLRLTAITSHLQRS